MVEGSFSSDIDFLHFPIRMSFMSSFLNTLMLVLEMQRKFPDCLPMNYGS